MTPSDDPCLLVPVDAPPPDHRATWSEWVLCCGWLVVVVLLWLVNR
jgi:hypothetical protein